MEWSMKVGRIRATLGALRTGLHPHIFAASQPSESQRVNPLDWIGRVLMQINATAQADRVHRDEPAGCCVIVPMPVVVQPRFGILLLPLKPERRLASTVRDCRQGIC